MDHAAELMNFVYNNREAAEKVGESGSKGIKTHFNPSKVSRIIQKRIETILSEASSHRTPNHR
jgi:hypothetical protein